MKRRWIFHDQNDTDNLSSWAFIVFAIPTLRILLFRCIVSLYLIHLVITLNANVVCQFTHHQVPQFMDVTFTTRKLANQVTSKCQTSTLFVADALTILTTNE